MPRFKLVDYDATDTGLILFTHAGIPLSAIERAITFFDLPAIDLQTASKATFAATLEAINKKFAERIASKQLQFSEVELPSHPLNDFVWYRHTADRIPTPQLPFNIYFVHGHHGDTSYPDEISVSLDTLLGKNLQANAHPEGYKALISQHRQLKHKHHHATSASEDESSEALMTENMPENTFGLIENTGASALKKQPLLSISKKPLHARHHASNTLKQQLAQPYELSRDTSKPHDDHHTNNPALSVGTMSIILSAAIGITTFQLGASMAMVCTSMCAGMILTHFIYHGTLWLMARTVDPATSGSSSPTASIHSSQDSEHSADSPSLDSEVPSTPIQPKAVTPARSLKARRLAGKTTTTATDALSSLNPTTELEEAREIKRAPRFNITN